ncbi:MAG: hypothetical protein ABJB47_15210, partial [Actinomycetota bacterium]
EAFWYAIAGQENLMTTNTPGHSLVTDLPAEDRPAPSGALGGMTDGSGMDTSAAESVTAALDRLREAASSHDCDSPLAL